MNKPTKALEAGLKLFPEKIIGTEKTILDPEAPVDVNLGKRILFMEGYKEAEKDLQLSVKDLQTLHAIIYAIKYNKTGAFTFQRLSEEQYKEVLKRFNETR